MTSSVAPSREPPDSGGSSEKQGGFSFKDKLLGNKGSVVPRKRVDLIKENLAGFDFADGNPLYPIFVLDESIRKEISDPWKEALVVKLLGKDIGFLAMRDRLKKLWKPVAGFDLLDLGHGFFLVKFDDEGDRSKVVDGGPWMLFDHYLAVQSWTPEFAASSAKIDRTMVWIRFPSLNVAYYDEDVLMALASGFGSPIKIDHNTLKVSRGKFARVCVEINLNKPVKGTVCVEGQWLKIEYEGLHIICTNCGCYGHYSRDCIVQEDPIRMNKEEQVMPPQHLVVQQPVKPYHGGQNLISNSNPIGVEIPKDPLGDWMIVARKSRGKFDQKNKGKKVVNDRESGGINASNRFQNLEVEKGDDVNKESPHVVAEYGVHANMQASREPHPKKTWKLKKRVVSPIKPSQKKESAVGHEKGNKNKVMHSPSKNDAIVGGSSPKQTKGPFGGILETGSTSKSTVKRGSKSTFSQRTRERQVLSLTEPKKNILKRSRMKLTSAHVELAIQSNINTRVESAKKEFLGGIKTHPPDNSSVDDDTNTTLVVNESMDETVMCTDGSIQMDEAESGGRA